ncbi:methyltransferase family protein [Thiohalorhabdus sp. Cl-TMA]|uniref:Isoprenylcysteine carboxylmethyltransferase family protein n=1 Tax=Thiohalorhabdus methylotrophus TaxID=3242694 RepID=A0ABV4TSE7_9GAMM
MSPRSLPSDKPHLPPPVFFVGALAVMAGLHAVLPLGRWLDWPWTLSGPAVIACGLGVGLAGARRFRRHATAVRPFEPASVLVTDGIFRYSRSPMYGGMVLMLLGAGLLLGTLAPLAVVPPFFLLLERRFVLREEALLEAAFGASYRTYRGRVRRWI